MERGYKAALVRKKILEARKFDHESLLDRSPRGNVEKPKLTLNIIYHPSFSRLRDILAKMHLLLSPD